MEPNPTDPMISGYPMETNPLDPMISGYSMEPNPAEISSIYQLTDVNYGSIQYPNASGPEDVYDLIFQPDQTTQPPHPSSAQSVQVVQLNYPQHPVNQLTACFTEQIDVNNPGYKNSPEYMSTSQPPTPKEASSQYFPSFQIVAGVKPVVELSGVPECLRFRYQSEIKPTPSASASGTSANSIKIKVSQYRGPLTIKVDLVDESHQPHVNSIYLPKQVHKWQLDPHENSLKLFDNQTELTRTYELPSYGVRRMKKEKASEPNATPRSEVEDHGQSTTKVVFRVTTEFHEIDECIIAYSNTVKDSKTGDANGDASLVHINPTTCRSSDESEITLLCENIGAKPKVVFCSPEINFKKYAAITYRHKKFALVVKAPKFCNSAGGKVQVFILTGPDNTIETNRMDFTYKAENEASLGGKKRPAAPLSIVGVTDVKRMLKEKIAAKQDLQCDGYDEVDSCPDLPCDDDDQDSLSKIAFELAKGEISYDERLCQILADSPQAMMSVDDYTPLAVAIIDGRARLVTAWLRLMSADLTNKLMQMKFGERCLTHFLLISQARENVKDLIDCMQDVEGVNTSDVDDDGNSLLHLFIMRQPEESVENLLSLASEHDWLKNLVDVRNCRERTPLHLAVQKDQPLTVQALVKAGADVNLKDNSNLSPLFSAVMGEKPIEMVNIFLETKGVDVNATDLNGQSALDIAYKQENHDICELLQLHGAIRKCEDSEEDESEDGEEAGSDDEDMDDEGEDSGSSEEADADAVATNGVTAPCISWEELKQELLKRLSDQDFKSLARHLDLPDSRLSLFGKTKEPSKFFFHIVQEDDAKKIPEALQKLGKGDLANYARRLSNA